MKFIFLLFFLYSICFPQENLQNPEIKKIISEVSADNIKSIVTKLTSFGTRHTLSDTVSETRGIGSARRWIKSEFEKYSANSNGRMSASFHESIIEKGGRVLFPVKVVNVVATLNPIKKTNDNIIIISGHYDSRNSDALDFTNDAPGANDDASGTAITMELARVFSKYNFDATLMFICFAGEEQGLLGAAKFAEYAKENNLKIIAVLNNDIAGSSRGGSGTENSYVRVFSEAFNQLDTGIVFQQINQLGLENDGASRSLARYVKETSENYIENFKVKTIFRRDRFLRGGDHTPFHQKGFAAVRFSEAIENYDHQHQNLREENKIEYGDLAKFMDFEYCANIAKVNASVAASLAFAPARPENFRLHTSQLEYDTKLSWNKNSEEDLSGYFVKYRSTSSGFWENEIFTRDTTITLKLSKDDLIFGIQSSDKNGNRSLTAVPKPFSGR